MYLITWEEQRVIADVCRIASRLAKRVLEWSITTGLVPSTTSVATGRRKDAATQDPLITLDKVLEDTEPSLYVFKDLDAFLKGQNIAVVGRLREVAFSLKNTYKTIVITSPLLELPPDLEKEITILDYELLTDSTLPVFWTG